jgi:hypothetical protein
MFRKFSKIIILLHTLLEINAPLRSSETGKKTLLYHHLDAVMG